MATVLCIEDEHLLRRDIADSLSEAGFDCLEAANGEEGLALILSCKPSLVLCDITMPGLDGFGVLRKLREEHHRYTEIPFVFLSALADRKDIVAGKELGADDYLTKPVDFDILIATVRARLVRMRRMDDKNQAEMEALRSSVLHSLPHELRTPLNHILGFADLLADQVHGPLGSPKYVSYVQYIHRSGNKLLETINTVLHLVDVSTGNVTPRTAALELQPFLQGLVEGVAAEAGNSKLSIKLRAYSGLTVLSDPILLGHAVEALLSNAIKFTPAGGSVLVSAEAMATGICIHIRDDGIGMDPEQLPLAYSAFGQLDGGLARKYEGSGLGLTLSKAIIERLGGTLAFTTEPGAGTTASIRLGQGD